jgi:hypothetical protein
MAQHDMNIANDTAPLVRADINNALSALVSQNSGASAPSTTYANMIWYDSTNNILKMRNEADDAWISLFYLDQGTDAFRILQNTLVTDTSGSQIGILGLQADGNWNAGSATTESLVSPAKIKGAINSIVGFDGNFAASVSSYSNGDTITVAHSLGIIPQLINAYARCTSADAGYTVGQQVQIQGMTVIGNGYYGGTVYADATNVYLQIATNGLYFLSSSGGASTVLTPANWDIRIYAWG